MRPKGIRGRVTWAAVLLLAAAAALQYWKAAGDRQPTPPGAASRLPVRPATALQGIERVHGVFLHGGSPLEVEAVIGWLDEFSRKGTRMPEGERLSLTGMLSLEIPEGMSDGSWHHLYNSACNALVAGGGPPDAGLLAVLETDAVSGRDRVIRLFALQHLGRNYAALDDTDQARLRGLVRGILEIPEADTMGTALLLWKHWEPDESSPSISAFDRSLEAAADSSLPLDVRIGALQVAGDFAGCLDLSRRLAGDRGQPALLRKAAIHLVGRYGEKNDLELLTRCTAENPRLAQAGEPALRTLQDRLSGKPPLRFLPYDTAAAE